MKTDLFNSVAQLAKNFKRKEVVLIKEQLANQEKKYGSKKLKLFNMLREQEGITVQQASIKLFGKHPSPGFRSLLCRLRDDLVDLLFMLETDNLTHEVKGNEKFRCRKLIAAGELLVSRKGGPLGRELLDEALTIANKYELHAEKLIILDYLRAADGFLHGLDTYKKYDEEVRNTLNSLNKLLDTRDLYFNFTLPNKFQKNREKEFIPYLQTHILQIEEYFKETGSSHIGYYLHYLKFYQQQILNHPNNAIREAEKLKNFINSRSALNSSTQIAATVMQVGAMCILLGRYDEAVMFSENSLKGIEKGSLSEIPCYDTIFLASFYQNKLEKAQQTIDKVFAHPRIGLDYVYSPQWVFYQTFVHHKRKEYRECNHLLNDLKKLRKDKTGWLFGLKLLEIMNLLGHGAEDSAGDVILGFVKLAKSKKTKAEPRVVLISQVLKTLKKCEFNFKEAADLSKDELMKLKSSAEYGWNPMGFELIRFEEWFEGNV